MLAKIRAGIGLALLAVALLALGGFAFVSRELVAEKAAKAIVAGQLTTALDANKAQVQAFEDLKAELERSTATVEANLAVTQETHARLGVLKQEITDVPDPPRSDACKLPATQLVLDRLRGEGPARGGGADPGGASAGAGLPAPLPARARRSP